MKNRVYHIEKNVYYNSFGIPSEPTFYIKYEDDYFYFFKQWKYAMYYDGGYGLSSWNRYAFTSVEKAQQFIDDVLCKQLPRQKTITEVVDTVQCK